MSTPKIRCPDCGRRASSSDAVCTECQSALLQLCECGATSHLSAIVCAECGDELRAPTYRRRPVVLRAVAVVVLLGLLGTAGAAYWNARQRKARKSEIWQLSDAAFASVKEGRYAEALPQLERYLASRPRDAQMQYLLAVTQRELDDSPLAGVAAARRTLEIDGSFSEAASLIARAYAESGDIDTAIEYAQKAVGGSRPTPADHLLLAMLELRRPGGDLDVAVASLEQARGGGDGDRLTVLMALLRLRQLGEVRIDTLPAELLPLVLKAEAVLLAADPETANEPFFRLAEIELAIVNGRAAPARVLAERLAADPEVTADVRLRAQILLGRAALSEGSERVAHDAFEVALREAPTASTALDVVRAYSAAGDLAGALELLRAAVDQPGSDPDLRTLLGATEAASGNVEAAIAGLVAARAERPDDVDLLVKLGDLLAASGRPSDADEAYAAAEAAAGPEKLVPVVRRALLGVASCATVAERRAKASDAIARLDAALGDPARWTDTVALEARGRLGILAGRAPEARALLERALELAPHDVASRLALAEAELAGGGEDSLKRAGELLVEASDLAPWDERTVVRVARLFMAMGRPRQANVVCQRFLDRVGARPAVLDVSADALRRMGLWGDAADALSQLRATAAQEPAPDLLRRTVDALLRAGRADEARELVVSVDPSNQDGRLSTLIALHGATPDERMRQLEQAGPSLELAFAYLARGERPAALTSLRGALASAPEDDAVRRVLVLLLLDGEDAGQAETELAEARRAAEATPANASAGMRELLMGAVQLAEGTPGLARGALAEAVEARPEDPFARFLYGRAMFECGDRADSLASMRRAVILPGALPGFARTLSRCVYVVASETEDDVARERLLWEALVHDTLNVAATVDLVNRLYATDREAQAARLARRLVGSVDLSDELAHGLRRLAVAAALRGTGFGDLLERIDEFPFDDVEATDQLIDGLLLLRAGRDVEALRLLERVRERHPESDVATTGVLEALVRRGALDEARRVALDADARVEGSTRFRLDLVKALLRAERYREALEESEALVGSEPVDAELFEARLRAHLRLADVPGALAELAEAETRANRDAAVRIMLLRCAVLRESDRGAEALAVVGEAAARAGEVEDLAALVRLAETEVLLSLGRLDEVRDRLTKLGFEPTGDAPALESRAAFVRGTVAMADGRAGDAERWLRAAVRLDPSAPSAANNLAWMLSTRPSLSREALALARRATGNEPAVADFWDTRGACARAAGLPDEAEEAWRRALELIEQAERAGVAPAGDSDLRTRVWVSLAEFLADQARFSEASAFARLALEADPPPELRQRARKIVRLE